MTLFTLDRDIARQLRSFIQRVIKFFSISTGFFIGCTFTLLDIGRAFGFFAYSGHYYGLNDVIYNLSAFVTALILFLPMQYRLIRHCSLIAITINLYIYAIHFYNLFFERGSDLNAGFSTISYITIGSFYVWNLSLALFIFYRWQNTKTLRAHYLESLKEGGFDQSSQTILAKCQHAVALSPFPIKELNTAYEQLLIAAEITRHYGEELAITWLHYCTMYQHASLSSSCDHNSKIGIYIGSYVRLHEGSWFDIQALAKKAIDQSLSYFSSEETPTSSFNTKKEAVDPITFTLITLRRGLAIAPVEINGLIK